VPVLQVRIGAASLPLSDVARWAIPINASDSGDNRVISLEYVALSRWLRHAYREPTYPHDRDRCLTSQLAQLLELVDMREQFLLVATAKLLLSHRMFEPFCQRNTGGRDPSLNDPLRHLLSGPRAATSRSIFPHRRCATWLARALPMECSGDSFAHPQRSARHCRSDHLFTFLSAVPLCIAMCSDLSLSISYCGSSGLA